MLNMPLDAQGRGAVQRELGRYELSGAVVGGYGEGSKTIYTLLKIAATGLSERHFIRMGFGSAKEAFGVCLQRVQREFACTAIMQQALLIHNRVDMIEYANRPGGGQQYEADEAPGTYENFNHQADRFYYGRSS
jgi:hypothetical protein